jgi:transcriptional regulator with XRE-family HTH domain
MGLMVRRLSSREYGFLAAMNVRQTIGWNLRRLRVAKGLSQERLALGADIDRSYVGRVERGAENVTVATLEALADVLQVHVSALFLEIEEGGSKPPPLRSGRKPKAS